MFHCTIVQRMEVFKSLNSLKLSIFEEQQRKLHIHTLTQDGPQGPQRFLSITLGASELIL